MGEYIKKLRNQHNLSQEALAKMINTDRSTLSKYENNRLSVPTDIIKKLSQIFSVSTDELITCGDKKNIEKIYEDNIKKSKRIRTSVFIIVALVIVILLLFLFNYFYTNYKAYQIYNIECDNHDISFSNSTLVITPNTILLSANDIKYKNNDNISKIELYYKINNTDYYVMSVNDTHDISIVDYSNYQEYFNFKNINYIVNNLYLRLFVDNQIIETKLNKRNIYINDNLFIKHDYGYIDDNTMVDNDYQLYKNIKDQSFEITYKNIKYQVEIYDNNLRITGNHDIYVTTYFLLDYINDNTNEIVSYNLQDNTYKDNKNEEKISLFFKLKKIIDKKLQEQ